MRILFALLAFSSSSSSSFRQLPALGDDRVRRVGTVSERGVSPFLQFFLLVDL
jgi:hypothetical protein